VTILGAYGALGFGLALRLSALHSVSAATLSDLGARLPDELWPGK
jgi:hypothetical protein